MATVNLGAIKFNWKGAYNNSTAYAVDDVVSSGGSSYICILASQGNAVSNGTYWNIMSQAGTNGTDVGTTLTTQGDILYRDGSGLQRLGAGTSGYFLKTQGTGANPVWSESSGGVIQTKYFIRDSSFTQSTSSFTDLGDFSLSITPTSTSNKIKLSVFFGAIDSAGNTSAFVYTRNGSQVGIGNAEGNRARASFTIQGTSYTASNHAEGTSHTFIDDPQTTSAITYKIQSATESGSLLYVNRPRDDGNVSDIYYSRTTSTFIAQEIVA
tara:strand:- start:203 stop:1006 length:804 start_codon:yes stop_codon:yes gene_type:complete